VFVAWLGASNGGSRVPARERLRRRVGLFPFVGKKGGLIKGFSRSNPGGGRRSILAFCVSCERTSEAAQGEPYSRFCVMRWLVVHARCERS